MLLYTFMHICWHLFYNEKIIYKIVNFWPKHDWIHVRFTIQFDFNLFLIKYPVRFNLFWSIIRSDLTFSDQVSGQIQPFLIKYPVRFNLFWSSIRSNSTFSDQVSSQIQLFLIKYPVKFNLFYYVYSSIG